MEFFRQVFPCKNIFSSLQDIFSEITLKSQMVWP